MKIYGFVSPAAPASLSGFLGTSLPQSSKSTCTQRKHSEIRQFHRVIIHCGRRGGGGRDNRRRGDGRRPNRVAELIRREISSIIDDAFSRAFANDERVSSVFVSVVDVKCSDDLRNARVRVSVFGTDEQKNLALQWLKGARKELRFELAQTVRLKYIPELSFSESEMAQALKTVSVLDKLAKEREEKLARASKGASSFANGHVSNLDASADDGLILEDLDMDGIFDIDVDGGDDAHIVNVTEDDEDLEAMKDDNLKRALFNTLGDEDFARR